MPTQSNPPVSPIGPRTALDLHSFFFILWVLTARTSAPAGIPSDQLEFFESRIRPILVGECVECHNSHGKSKGGLQLDHRSGWEKGGLNGPALNKGKPETSLLIRAVKHELPELEMPKSRAKLEDSMIRDLETWIRMGAPDPRDSPSSDPESRDGSDWDRIMEARKAWWSFQPIQAVAPPKVPGTRHPVDSFIHQALKEKGLSPAPPARPEHLIRRLYYNLIGLPPSADDTAAFNLAYEKHPEQAVLDLIDELLANPHFGEKWALHWMDWVRYAESHGSEGDPLIVHADQYRDYLIRALNGDIPYDQLIKEHMAGDLLSKPRINPELGINESVIGTAHWRMVFHGFAPTDALEEKVRFTDDQINVFSKAFLGLTVSCARCHNHKFDPISQEDYYALFGILGSSRPGRAPMETSEVLHGADEALRVVKSRIRSILADHWLKTVDSLEASILEDRILRADGGNPGRIRLFQEIKPLTEPDVGFKEVWEKTVVEWKRKTAQWSDRAHESIVHWDFSSNEAVKQWYGYGGPSHYHEAGDFTLREQGEDIVREIRPSGVYSDGISTKHGLRFTSPDIVLEQDWILWMLVAGDGQSMARYAVRNYPRDGTVYPVSGFNGPKAADWHWIRFDLSYWKGDSVYVELCTALDAPLLVKNNPRSWFAVRDVMLLPKDAPPPPNPDPMVLQALLDSAKDNPPASLGELLGLLKESVKQAIHAWKSNRLDDSTALLLNDWIAAGILPNQTTEIPELREWVLSYRSLEDTIPVATRIPSLDEWRGSDQRLFERGNHKNPRQEVPRRFLEAIQSEPYRTGLSGRMELAESLLNPHNPFTSRVMVNRIWHHLFGTGLVATPDNFGRLGAEPSHPELLDYLARRFTMTDRWSIKSMIQLIVSSHTWQQSSDVGEGLSVIDPDNRWLSRYPVRRLDAESIRDSLLFSAKNLRNDAGGRTGSASEGSIRSVYLPVIRNRPDPFLAAWDKPVPFSTTGRRNATTVPAQSLAMMNSPLVEATSEKIAQNALNTDYENNPRETVRQMWRQVLGRNPLIREEEKSLRLLQELNATYERDRATRRDTLEEIQGLQSELSAMLHAARQTPGENEHRLDSIAHGSLPEPLAEWDFSSFRENPTGHPPLHLHGNARIENGSLILDGESWASTDPIGTGIREKSMEAVVLLDNLSQQGGGVLTLQSLDGQVFDSIVFGEQESGHWLAGSNFFERTRSFKGFKEDSADKRSVHLALITHANGRVELYRNGQRYGEGYTAPTEGFSAGAGMVLLGMRHGLSTTQGRMLKGRIQLARLYDRALSDEEIKMAAAQARVESNDSLLIDRMPEADKKRYDSLITRKRSLEQKVIEMRKAPSAHQHWKDLAHSLLNLKEFIYVR